MTGSDRQRPGVKLTYDDFVLFPDDGKRHELIDGEHYVTPSPNLKHQAVCGNLHGRIWNYLQERPIGKIYSAPLDVVRVYRLENGRYQRAQELSLDHGDVLTTPLLPGLDRIDALRRLRGLARR